MSTPTIINDSNNLTVSSPLINCESYLSKVSSGTTIDNEPLSALEKSIMYLEIVPCKIPQYFELDESANKALASSFNWSCSSFNESIALNGSSIKPAKSKSKSSTAIIKALKSFCFTTLTVFVSNSEFSFKTIQSFASEELIGIAINSPAYWSSK